MGKTRKDPHDTILTEQEFCVILTELRDSDKNVEIRSSLYKQY